MTSEVILKFKNPHELARLLNLIEDGHKILSHQDRSQRGLDGYTSSDLDKWHKTISNCTSVRCKYANGTIF